MNPQILSKIGTIINCSNGEILILGIKIFSIVKIIVQLTTSDILIKFHLRTLVGQLWEINHKVIFIHTKKITPHQIT